MVLMDDDPAKIALAMRIARRTLRIVHQNIVFALGIKRCACCWVHWHCRNVGSHLCGRGRDGHCRAQRHPRPVYQGSDQKLT